MSGGEGAETGEGIGDSAVAVLHVDDDEIVAGETSDLGKSGGEGKEEETVEGFAIAETGLQCWIEGKRRGSERTRGVNGRWN